MEIIILRCGVIYLSAMIPLFIINNKRKSAFAIGCIVILCLIAIVVLPLKQQQLQDKECESIPSSHITGSMVHSQDCPNPLNDDSIRKEE